MSSIITPAEWPQKKYACILADPPWRFVGWCDNGRKVPDIHYQTMTDEDIAGIPVASVAADDCTLFLWTTCPHMPAALRIIEAWGFEYKTFGFSWVKVITENPRKPRMGLGSWTRANTEPCLLATKGHPKRLHKDVGQVIAAPIREHSRKPDETHTRIERLVAGPYLELFARAPREGWDVWGNETNKFNDLVLDMEVTR
jgi:N6-adenosine-specific RNA methylase IME4